MQKGKPTPEKNVSAFSRLKGVKSLIPRPIPRFINGNFTL